MSIVKSGIVVGFYTLLSRILGYARDILIASNLGAGMLSDVFVVAFKLPNFFRRLFAEGGLAPAFVPIYSGKLTTSGEKDAGEFGNKVFSLLFLILVVFVAILEIFMPYLMYVLAPGFSADPEKFALSIYLSRVTLPYLLFISLVSLVSGMLNSIGKFAAASASPIILNLTMLLGIAYLANYTETPAHALCISIFLAGIFQLTAIIYSAKKAGIFVKFTKFRIDKDIKELLKKMLPSIVGGGITQINLWVDTIIATLISSGAASLLYYADRLNQLPLALIGTAMGTVLLPVLSKKIKENDFREANLLQNKALEVSLFLSLPCTIILFTLSDPIIHVLFERGEFTHEITGKVAWALSAFALGLPAFVGLKIFTTSFFSNGDTKTPVQTALVTMVINIVLNLILMRYLAHVGVALATSISSWINLIILNYISTKRGIFLYEGEIVKKIGKIALIGIVMGFACFGLEHLLYDTMLTQNTAFKLLMLILMLSISGILYLALCFYFKAIDIGYLLFLPKRFMRR